MRTTAIIVAFDVCRDPAKTLGHVLSAVDYAVIVDNVPGGHPALVSKPPPRSAIIQNGNRGGVAGAYNRALAHVMRDWPETTHVMFLDDDTDVGTIKTFLASPVTRRAVEDPAYAAVAPVYKDPTTGLRGAHIQLKPFCYRVVARNVDSALPVTFVINSMSLWRLEAIMALGTYSEVLAVDHVDTEFCLRAKRAGYRILLNSTIEFLHPIGQRKPYRLLGVTFQAGGHSPPRRRSIARNTMLLAKSYLWIYPAFSFLCLTRIAYEVTGIVMAEENKLKKVQAVFAGALAGLFLLRLPRNPTVGPRKREPGGL